MDLLFREAMLAEDDGHTHPDKGWEDAEEAGIELSMVALRRDGFLAAFI